MKKRISLVLIVVLDYFIGIYLGYQRSASYQVLAVPSILVGLFQGVCIGLLVWGRMEDLSLKNLKLDAFSAVRLVITLVLLVVAHLIAWRWGLVKIHLLDHFILTDTEYFSMRDANRLPIFDFKTGTLFWP